MRESSKLFVDINDSIIDNRIMKKIPDNSIILKRDDKIISNYLSYCSIENDLEFISEATSELISIRLRDNEHITDNSYYDFNLILKRSLFISILTSYGRCFKFSKGRISLNEQFITRDYSENLLSKENALLFHRHMLNLRDKFIAHVDETFYERTIGFMHFELNDRLLDVSINYVTGILYSFNENELENLLILSRVLLTNIEQKKTQITNKIINKFSRDELILLGLKAIKGQSL